MRVEGGDTPITKYEALGTYLGKLDGPTVSMTFREIEDALEFPLPNSAKRYAAFWSNPSVALPLARAGWRARPGIAEGRVAFIRTVDTKLARPEPPTTEGPLPESDILLVGCVKTKRPGRHTAMNLYNSSLFEGRRAYAERTGRPWFILSAHYGFLRPNQEIDSYDLGMGDLSSRQRAEWAERVLSDLDAELGPVIGKSFEIHAGQEYRESGLRRGLEARGAKVLVPLAHAGLGQQIAWYRKPEQPPTAEVPKNTEHLIASSARAIATSISTEFSNGTLDLSARQNAPKPGWSAMPECVAVHRIQTAGATHAETRTFLTLVAAMDRARDAERLWANAANLFLKEKWAFQTSLALTRPLYELRDVLAISGVSQRHGPDSAAWRLILEAIASDSSPVSFRRAILEGEGDARELLATAKAVRESGQPWLPFLSGPKLSAMWVRMLADPGGASVANISAVPVAVDVQVRKVSEYLGVTKTAGTDLEAVRDEIQETWSFLAEDADGPPALKGTAAGLDPALWFFGRWGCTFCERAKQRLPISSACSQCKFSS